MRVGDKRPTTALLPSITTVVQLAGNHPEDQHQFQPFAENLSCNKRRRRQNPEEDERFERASFRRESAGRSFYTMEERRPVTEVAGNTQLVFYSRSAGVGLVFRANAEGKAFDLVRSHDNWSKSWDIIVSGKFGGNSGQDDLLFYSRTGVGSFYEISGDGSLQGIQSHTNWAKTWSIIVPIKSSVFGGSIRRSGGDGDLDKLLFYDRQNGVGYFFAVTKEPRGMLIPLSEPQRGWAQWDNIVALDNALLFYRYPGQCCLYSIADARGTVQFMKKYDFGNFEWNCIVPGRFSAQPRPGASDVLLYERKSGTAAMYSFGSDLKAHFEQRSWAKGWTFILPGILHPEQDPARIDDLFCFDCSISKGASFSDNGQNVLARLVCENKMWTNIVAVKNYRGTEITPTPTRRPPPEIIDLDAPARTQPAVGDGELVARVRVLAGQNEELTQQNLALKKENEELKQALNRMQGDKLEGLSKEELMHLEEKLVTAMRKVAAKRAESEVKEKEAEKKLCVVCMDKERNIVFVECSHLCCCKDCSDALRNCPLCRATIVTKLRVYDINS